MKTILLIALVVNARIAWAQTACADYPRTLNAPPASGLRSLMRFRENNTDIIKRGTPRGFKFSVEVVLTNVGSLRQTATVELTNVNFSAHIKGDVDPYDPPPWSKSDSPAYGTIQPVPLNASDYDFLKGTVSINPGGTTRLTLKIACPLNYNPIRGCTNGDIGALLGLPIPTYPGFSMPYYSIISATTGLRLCVKGPAGKESLGAVIGSISYRLSAWGSAPPGSYVDDGEAMDEFTAPLLAGFAF